MTLTFDIEKKRKKKSERITFTIIEYTENLFIPSAFVSKDAEAFNFPTDQCHRKFPLNKLKGPHSMRANGGLPPMILEPFPTDFQPVPTLMASNNINNK